MKKAVARASGLGLNVLTSLSLGQYIKASVWDFPVMTSLSVNIRSILAVIKDYESAFDAVEMFIQIP